MSIVTKTGDRGQTGLVGGQRVSKASARLHAYGTVDELNALLGLIVAEFAGQRLAEHIREKLEHIQHQLFRLGADLATPQSTAIKVPRVERQHTAALESWVITLEVQLPSQTTFILPGGTRLAALLHHARTVCRRAERWVVDLSEQNKNEVNEEAIVYLNRLSDVLFLLARATNKVMGIEDQKVDYSA